MNRPRPLKLKVGCRSSRIGKAKRNKGKLGDSLREKRRASVGRPAEIEVEVVLLLVFEGNGVTREGLCGLLEGRAVRAQNTAPDLVLET